MRLICGARLAGVKPELVAAMVIADSVLKTLGHELYVTSLTEGKHMAGSLHYAGMAFDCRSNDLGPSLEKVAVSALAQALGPDFDVVKEADHIHVEYQPKTGVNG